MRPVLPACVEEVGFSLCVWVWPCLASSSEDAGLQRLRGSALGGRGGGARRLALGSLLSLVSEDHCLDPRNMHRSRS